MASRFEEGRDDMCGAWTPYAWINFPDQAGFWRILSRGIFKGMKLFFFFKRKCQYKYEIETFLLRSSSIITIVIFMSKFYNFIISRTTITFNNISTIHKNIFILSNRTYFFFSPCAKLNFSRSDFRQNCANFEKYFLPMWKFVIHGFIIYRKRDIEYSSRGEKSNTEGGGGEGKILIGQHSPRILSMRQHAEMCSLPG